MGGRNSTGKVERLCASGPVAGSGDPIHWSPVPDKFLPPPFRVDVAYHGDEARLSPVGELDMSTVPHLEAALEDASLPGRQVIVDLRGLDFMDSTGLQSLMRATMYARENGRDLRFVRPSGQVEDVMRLTRVDKMLPFADVSDGDDGG